MLNDDTITALATPFGYGSISVIRISGNQSISIVSQIFRSIKNDKKLEDQPSHTIHLGYIQNNDNNNNKKYSFLDKVLVSIFRNPLSYTGENMVEISCHGSHYIQQNILQLLVRNGVRLARAGEFTFRAFLNKKIDLSQAEAISDLISSNNKVYHDISLQHVKGSLSNMIKKLRKDLLDFASMLELDLDFHEEKVRISDRIELCQVLQKLIQILKNLVESFSLGNAIKTGFVVAIAGETNVGKSTLFNQIIQENRSIISPIGGTTRDIIEEFMILKGIPIRFLDTAGMSKNVNDPIEYMGIQNTMRKIENAQLILYVFDSSFDEKKQKEMISIIQNISQKNFPKIIFAIANKSDICPFHDLIDIKSKVDGFFHISAKKGEGIQEMLSSLSNVFMKKLKKRKYIVLQHRHYESFKNSLNEIKLAYDSLKRGVSEEFILIHIKCASNHLGEIIGEITNEDILNNIFSKFCIGK